MKKANPTVDLKDILLVCLIAVLAISFRVSYFREYVSTDVYPVLSYSDAYYYQSWARDIASGDFLGKRVFMKWPFYAYFLALLFKVSHNSMLFVYLFQNMLGVLHCLLLYAIARYFFNRTVACIAALVSVWYVFFIFYDNLLIYTSLSLFLNALFFIGLLIVQERFSSLELFLTGLFLGVCTLTQANILLCGIAAMIWILWQQKLLLRQRLSRFLIFFSGVLLLLGVVGVRNYAVAKDKVLFTAHAGMNFFLGNNAEANGLFHCPDYFSSNQEGMFRDAQIIARASSKHPLSASQTNTFWFQEGWKFIKSKPGVFLGLLRNKAIYLFSGDEFIHDAEYPSTEKIPLFRFLLADLKVILPFALVGMLALIPSIRRTGLLYVMVFMYSLSILPFFVTTRYRIMQVPFLIIFASSGAWSFWDSLKRRQFVKLGFLYAWVLLFYFLCNHNGLLQRRNEYQGSSAQRFDQSLGKAVRLTTASKYAQAVAEAGKAVALNPQSLQSLFALAVAQFHAGEFKNAEQNFKRTIELFPYVVDSYYNLGVLYYRQGRFKEAKEMLVRAVSLDPEDVSAHFELARTLREMGLFRRAASEYRAALQRLSPWRTDEIALIRRELSLLPE